MFSISEAIEILERTPKVLDQLLSGLSTSWTQPNEGTDTWSPFDIVGHLIHGEQTDWIIRTKSILENDPKPFEPFDRFAQFENSKDKTISQLLEEFKVLRIRNLGVLKKLELSDEDFEKTGVHPEFGEVSLKQLISTWVVHDLGHIRQIVRVMAKLYSDEVGPWAEYLSVIKE